MVARTPPKFVPTLTEVVRSPPAAAPEPVFFEDQLVVKVMQRVDLSLERRLREAIATVLLEHTRSLGPAIRQEVEAAVRQAVTQALADEIASQQQAGAKPRK
ncbi:MAG: hypothetical protein HY854_24315 [Burkholderiales bacterium]|nr:hypothetical protein [Burkholderiales bacterium]